MTRTRRRIVASALLLVLFSVARTYAGGPLLVHSPGVPFRWPNGGMNIPWNPDQGGLGPLTNAQAVAQTAAAFQAWADIASSTATHLNAGQLPLDVDETNFVPFFAATAPDGLSAIVFDEDGAIFELLFGPDSGVLGFAGPEWVDESNATIVEGLAFMNGGALLGPDAFPIAEMLSVQVHEFGHYQNLAHTVVNGQAAGFGDHTGPSPNDTFPRPATFANRIETMYPFLFINGGQATPHADDIAIFSFLYPEATFAASTGAISGRILGPNNTARLTGVNVIARNIANPFDDAVSAISSDFTNNYAVGAPLVGTYTLRGLTPGASYAVFVDQILAGGFSTPPRVLPGPEEFYNGPLESNNIVTDVPNVFTPIVAAAGVTARNINIIFNRTPPGPIAAGDDTSTEIFPFFRMRVCGDVYESLFVNSNGNITFGAGSTSFSESPAGHLTGPPRLAALWDDLNAAAGGSVSYSETPASVTVSFVNVPEFAPPAGGTGSNTFSMTVTAALGPLDSGFEIDLDALSATDGLTGYSCGGRITSGFERERDLSAVRFGILLTHGRAAIYEVFTAGDNDLDNRTFRFLGPGEFRDPFEPNDTVARGEFVKLPFSTVDRFSAIKPLGDDVDFYRFEAKAGDILAIETVPGLQSMDTVVGIFDSGGNLLLADDDGGAGVLSRLLVQVLADGTYAVGVSTFPDFAFTGSGEDFGRYVLQINRYRGTVLPVGDDSSVAVPLTTFAFPFQGTNWTSVFVNGNGNLTFGAANGDFSETVPELLSGPPRIAPLWDDLNATAGLVIAEERGTSLFVHFVSVPEFLVTGTNYFTVELDKRGGVNIDWYATNRSDGIVGLTQGGGAPDPGPTDLSHTRRLSAVGTTYEGFVGSFGTYGGVDLSYSSVRFKR
jgi:hypothetical protein